VKLPLGVIEDESIWITHFVTDDDGSLKIKEVEQFTDSKAHFDTVAATEHAK
jgi:hypothetical protein